MELTMPGGYNRKDKLYNRAKEQGFRSRAYYKLEELNIKHHLLKPGYRVLDLGAWPGGWLQYAAKIITPSGLVVGIDLVEIEALDLPHVQTLQGDVRDVSLLEQAASLAGRKFDVVLSDMSPKLSGIREVDEAAVLKVAEAALCTCPICLKKEGTLVIKLFKGRGMDEFVQRCRLEFKKAVREELGSSRKTSNEYYLVCEGYKPQGF